MCGIVGGTNHAWPFIQAVAQLRHRGPDAQQTVVAGRVTLGFARLAIIDLSPAANQPMASPDQTVWLVFNGEIYGYRALRRQLEQLGWSFRTQSDTEVVLNAYLAWGESFVERIDGMFALAIYDRRSEKLLLYRDRPGIKPLYYFWDGHDFAFASELKAIQTLCGDRLAIDNTAVYDFVTYRYVPSPKTLYQHTFKMPPASRLVLDLRQMELDPICRYWTLPDPAPELRTIGINDACAELRSLVEQSVEEQLVADVPVGCFLSGGLDSSMIVAAASKRHSRLQTFSIGFDDPQHTETHYARQVAERFATQHRQATFSRDALRTLLPCVKGWYDEPFGDLSALPTYCVSRFAREHVTVALSGDGGDELFGGYAWYPTYRSWLRRGMARSRVWGRWLEQARRQFSKGSWIGKAVGLATFLSTDPWSLYHICMKGMTSLDRAQYAKELGIDADYDDYWHFREHWRDDLPLYTALQRLDFHTLLPDDMLTKVDRASMAVSLEVRVPLLSRSLIEFAFRLPESVRYHSSQLKGLVKQAYRDLLPASIVDRRKQGFSTPAAYVAPGTKPPRAAILEMYGIGT